MDDKTKGINPSMWLETLRKDSALTETIVARGQSMFLQAGIIPISAILLVSASRIETFLEKLHAAGRQDVVETFCTRDLKAIVASISRLQELAEKLRKKNQQENIIPFNKGKK